MTDLITSFFFISKEFHIRQALVQGHNILHSGWETECQLAAQIPHYSPKLCNNVFYTTK